MVHSEVYLNKYVVSIAPFSTPACPGCSQNNNTNVGNCSFCMFSLCNFSAIFPGGQLTPFAPVCGCPWQPWYDVLVNWPFTGGLLRLVQQGSERMNAVANAAADKWPSSSGFCTGTKRHTDSFSGTHKTTRKAHTTCFKKPTPFSWEQKTN